MKVTKKDWESKQELNEEKNVKREYGKTGNKISLKK